MLARRPLIVAGCVARTEGGLVGLAVPVRVESGEERGVDVVARPGGRVRPTASLLDPALHLSASVSGFPVDIHPVPPSGSVLTRVLPPGPVTLELLRPGEVAGAREAFVVAGETAGVAFD